MKNHHATRERFVTAEHIKLTLGIESRLLRKLVKTGRIPAPERRPVTRTTIQPVWREHDIERRLDRIMYEADVLRQRKQPQAHQ